MRKLSWTFSYPSTVVGTPNKYSLTRIKEKGIIGQAEAENKKIENIRTVCRTCMFDEFDEDTVPENFSVSI